MTAVQSINPERAWAEGMTQQEFDSAYRIKCGGVVDTVPFVDEWVYKFERKARTINLPTPEDITDDKMASELAKKKDAIEAEKKAGFICKGCGKECKAKIGLIAHEKACKLYLNLR